VNGRGITVDTGFLIALEKNKGRAVALVNFAKHDRLRITVPAAVLAEWWRGRRQSSYVEALEIEPMSAELARRAGEAIAAVPRATVVDAIVMASAAQREDVVYTSDFDDLARLRDQHFHGVRVMGV
jgi:predicted nucleic acid-binding protein